MKPPSIRPSSLRFGAPARPAVGSAAFRRRWIGAALPGALLAGLLCAVPGAAVGQQMMERPERRPPATVRVTASGGVEVEPDRVVLAVGVETFADSAGTAAALNAERTAAVLAALRSAGVGDDGLETSGYLLEPEYANQGPEERGPRRIARYRAWNMVRVTVDSVGRAGRLIDRAVAAGANRVAGISFELADDEEPRRRALAEAVGTARARAEALAAAAGVRLGRLLRLETGGGDGPVPYGGEMMLRGASTPVEPGAIRVETTVTAIWRLEGAEGR